MPEAKLRYKDPTMEACYQNALKAAADPKSEFYYNGKPHRGAGHRCAFWDGYNGLERSANVIPGTMSQAFFQAGKEWSRRQKVAAKKPVLAVGKAFETMAKRAILGELKESNWFKTAPAAARAVEPEITLIGIEEHEVFASMGVVSLGSRMRPFVVAETVVGGIKTRLRLRIELGGGGLVIGDEEAVEQP